MRNLLVFNDLSRSLFTWGARNLIHEGRLFVATTGVLAATKSAQNTALLLTNPTGSGVHLHLEQVIVAADTDAWLSLLFDVTAATGLTARSVLNLNRRLPDGLNKGTVAAGGGTGVAVTGGVAALTWRLQGNASALLPLERGAFIAEGKNVGVQAVFETGGRSAFTLVWWEEPITEL